MTGRAAAILGINLALLAFFLGSVGALAWNSRDFLLADRQAALPQLPIGEPVDFASPGDQAGMLLGGWYRSAAGGAVAMKRTATLALKLPPGNASVLTFNSPIATEAPGEPAARRIRISLDGKALAMLTIAGGQGDAACTWSLPLPPTDRALSMLDFALLWPSSAAAEPALNVNHLMLGLRSLTLSGAPQPTQCAGGATLALSPA